MLLNCDVEDFWESLGLQGDQSWVFIGRTDVEAETPILWPPDAECWLIWKDPDAGKDWGQEEKGMTENEMVGWHHWLDEHRFGWTPGSDDGQGGLGVLWFMGPQRVGHDWVMNWTEYCVIPGLGLSLFYRPNCSNCHSRHSSRRHQVYHTLYFFWYYSALHDLA